MAGTVADSTEMRAGIQLDVALINSVDEEVRALAFDDFRHEEHDAMQAQNPMVYEFSTTVFSGLHKRSEAEAYRAQTGLLYAHRLLRRANHDQPLPLKTLEHLKILLERHALGNVALVGSQTVDADTVMETEFKSIFNGNDEVREAFDSKFSNPASQWGARLLLVLYGEHVTFS